MPAAAPWPESSFSLFTVGELAGLVFLFAAAFFGALFAISRLHLFLHQTSGYRYGRAAVRRGVPLFYRLVRRSEALVASEQLPALLLDPGPWSSSAEWWRFQDLVAPIAATLAWDRPGSGFSFGSALARRPEVTAEDLRETARQAGLRPPYVLAGYLNCAAALHAFAQRWPQECAGILLLAGEAAHEAPADEIAGKYWSLRWPLAYYLPPLAQKNQSKLPQSRLSRRVLRMNRLDPRDARTAIEEELVAESLASWNPPHAPARRDRVLYSLPGNESELVQAILAEVKAITAGK